MYAVASEINSKSEKVMQKIGMQKTKISNHPKLKEYAHLESCVLSMIKKLHLFYKCYFFSYFFIRPDIYDQIIQSIC